MRPELNLYDMGRDALAAARAAFAGRASFVSARRLQVDGLWLGPPEATLAVVEEVALSGLGGLAAASKLGANAVICNSDGILAGQATGFGMRVLFLVPFASGESDEARHTRLAELGELIGRIPGIDGILPAPVGEAQGLDTLQFFAACRVACPDSHIVVDLERFGLKLGQLCLSFGADEILGAISGQRALRLGAQASSNALTRDEAVVFLRASGFEPCETMPEGKVQEL